MATVEDTTGSLPAIVGAGASADGVEKADSEYECELMIEALKKELSAVRNQLAYLTHHLDGGDHTQPQEEGGAAQLHSCVEMEANESRPLSRPSDTVLAGDRGDGRTLANYSGSQTIADTVATGTNFHGQRNKLLRKNIKSVGGTTDAEEKERHRHYLQVVDHAEKRSWEARKRCLVLMQTHIEKQLKMLQERSTKFQRKLARIKQKERAEKLKLKPPRYKSTGVDDTSFLARVHQSTFYKIVGIEHELKVEGKLKTIADLKEFWDHMLAPTRSTSEATPPPPSQLRPLSTPFTFDEDDDEEYSDSWAITALPPQRSFTPKRSPFPVHTIIPITPSTPESLRFIPMKVPQFKTVADILGTEKLNEVESESICHPRSRELEVGRRMLYHMYQQARAHEMTMTRLLPEVPCFNPQPLFAEAAEREERKPLPATTKPPEKELSHQIEQFHHEVRPPSQLQPDTTSSKTNFPSSEVISIHSQTVRLGGSDEMFNEEESEDSRKHATSRESGDLRTDNKIHKPVLIPLTMDSAMDNFPVRESKCKSALWTNYLKTGRCS